YERELELLDELIRRAPARASLRGDRGLARFFAGRKSDAIPDLEEAIRLDPAWAPSYLTLGAIYAREGKTAKAREVYEQGLSAVRKDDKLRPELYRSREALGPSAVSSIKKQRL